MHFRTLALASSISAAAGQSITDALTGQPMLSNLTAYLNLYPSFLTTLQSMSDITLLAPSNMAFTDFSTEDTDITSLFSYHVINGTYSNFSSMPTFVPTALMPGMYANVSAGQVVEAISSSDTTTFYSGLLSNSSIVSNGTFNFTGGVIHAIDNFLTIPENITNTAVQLNLRAAVGALTLAGLANTVDTLTDVTCFVPNNEAFQAVGATLATSSPEDISRILEYHVLNGTVGYSSTLTNGSMLTTMNGITVTITVEDDVVFVNSARVVTPNVLVANGVVHVIDGVLNPGNRTATANPSASTQAPAFSDATSAEGTPFTSGVPQATTSINTAAPTSLASAAATGGGPDSGASSSSEGIAMPMKTGAVGAAALFGGAAAIMNI